MQKKISDQEAIIDYCNRLKYPYVGYCPIGVYTIVDTVAADGYTWGELKSGAGLIALKYTKNVEQLGIISAILHFSIAVL